MTFRPSRDSGLSLPPPRTAPAPLRRGSPRLSRAPASRRRGVLPPFYPPLLVMFGNSWEDKQFARSGRAGGKEKGRAEKTRKNERERKKPTKINKTTTTTLNNRERL